MLFLVSKDPFSALQLQQQLRLIAASPVEIYLSVEEAESNLYKLPRLVLLEDNLEAPNLLYLTESIKLYDSQIALIWLCRKEHTGLEKIHKGYGVASCLTRDDQLPGQLSVKVQEILKGLKENDTKKRVRLLKKKLFDTSSSKG